MLHDNHMDIAAITEHLKTVINLPHGVEIKARVPNNYLGVPDAANAYIVVRVNNVCDAKRKFRTPTQQRDLALDLKRELLKHLPARCSKVHATYFGMYTQYRDGYAFEAFPRFVVAA